MPHPAQTPPSRPRRKSPPYPFLLEALAPLNPEVRPMFGGHAVYIGDTIVAMLRESRKSPEDNGLWLVFSEIAPLANPSLQSEFPSLRPIHLLDGKIGHWQLLPADHPAFETNSLHACDLILRHDPRIGRIPISRQSKSSRKQPKKS